MFDVSVERKFEVTVKMNRDAAIWLLELVKHPVVRLSKVNEEILEADYDKKYREKLLGYLKGHGIERS